MNEIKTIADTVISEINHNWNKRQIIRYTYLKVGQIIEKNADFFLNDKLGPYKLTDDEFLDIYNNNTLYQRENKKGETMYQVICRSAGAILKEIFDRTNIDSQLVYTTGADNPDIDIRHWFVVAKDDDNNQYFLTLAADLPFIKNNFPTEHFASHLNYFSKDGTPNYIIPEDNHMLLNEIVDNNGNKGYEIAHTILTEEQLQQLDNSIGFGKLYETQDIMNSPTFLALYYSFVESNSEIYDIYRKSLNIGEERSTSVYMIDNNEIDNFITNIDKYITSRIEAPNEVISNISKEIENLTYNEENDIFRFISDNRKLLKKIKNPETKELVGMLSMVVEIKQRFLELKNTKQRITDYYANHEDKNSDIKEEKLLWEKYKNAIKNISILEISPILDRIALYFLKEKLIIKNKNDYVSTDYIINKFVLMFPLVFDCSYNNNKVPNMNSFSIQNYSEQIVIIKKMLALIFAELTEKNCKDIEDYNISYSPVENRIKAYPLKDKQTGNYAIGFRFGTKKEENAPILIYIPSENVLKARDPIDDRDKYWICSKRFNSSLQKVEDMEEKLIPENKTR